MSVSGGPELTFNDASGDFVVALSTTPSPSLTLRPIGTGESVYLHAGTTESPNASLGLGLPPNGVLMVAGSHNAIEMFGSAGTFRVNLDEIGRASCRERVWISYVEISLVDKEVYW